MKNPALWDSLSLEEKANAISMLVAWVDQNVRKRTSSTQEASPQDKRFDKLMTRFEIMQPHKELFLKIASDSRRTPILAYTMAKALRNSIGSLPALAAYLFTFCAWERETDPALPQTMARLDRGLKKTGGLSHRLR